MIEKDLIGKTIEKIDIDGAVLRSEVQGLSRKSETCATWVCKVQILTRILNSLSNRQ